MTSMPWKESRIVNERVRFIADVLKGEQTLTELCLLYGIARKTGYKWIERFQQAGPAGLEDLDRRPQSCAHATPDVIVQQILELRSEHPTWGPRKLRARLEQPRGDTDWPAASTISAILRRAGLVHARKHKRRVTPSSSPLGEITAPNQVWCMDFKGFFRCGNQERCDPFTITDAFSRYLIRCQAVPRTTFEYVDAICEAAMREYGLPERIRTDNGSPFATTSVRGLSRLSIKWIKLGIVHERIEPGEPQQNGRHERMHRTLKRDTATPPAFSLREQQDRFDHFRHCFNEERPHEALAFATPGSVYVANSRPYPSTLPEPTYGPELETRRVKNMGAIKMKGGLIFLSEMLCHEMVGLLPREEDRYTVYFGPVLLGEIDLYLRTFTRVR
jgi:transposase InsO family protein